MNTKNNNKPKNDFNNNNKALSNHLKKSTDHKKKDFKTTIKTLKHQKKTQSKNIPPIYKENRIGLPNYKAS